jgi:uncharacterized membrane protein
LTAGKAAPGAVGAGGTPETGSDMLAAITPVARMPASDTRLPNGSCQFILRPNGSLTPSGARRFLLLIGSMTIAIALPFALHGFWPVLAIAVLEIAALGWALYLSMRASRRSEAIFVDGDTVRVERVDRTGLHSVEFTRHWARVTLLAVVATHRSRLFIESHGRGCEVGRFLTEEERQAFARRLRQLIGGVNRSPPLDPLR